MNHVYYDDNKKIKKMVITKKNENFGIEAVSFKKKQWSRKFVLLSHRLNKTKIFWRKK